MALDGSLGQDAAVGALRALLCSGRLPHALLFLGAEGTGRLATARELAAVLACTGDAAPDASCDQCPGCRLMAQGRHPDYSEVGVAEGRQSVSIETVRETQHLAALKPVMSERRVFVIRDAERLSLDAANCLLKTLEEPPGTSLFILLASSLRDIPPTITSRCRLMRFRNLPLDALQARLEAEGRPAEEAHWLALRSWGSPGLARRLQQMDMYALHRRLADAVARMSLEDNFDLSDLLNGAATAAGGSATEARQVLQDLLECIAMLYRDLALAAACGGDADPCTDELPPGVREMASGRTPEFFLAQADLVLEAIERIGSNANRQITLDNLFTQLALATQGAA